MSSFTLLLVDDNEEILALFAKWFRRRGFLVTAVSTPNEAIEIAESTKFDVAVVDMALPEMNGLELIERLRQSFDFQAIILSGDDNPKLSNLAAVGRVFRYLLKPVSMKIVEEAILESLKAASVQVATTL